MNATNVSRNGTRHAELMAISALLSYSPDAKMEPPQRQPLTEMTNLASPKVISQASWGDVDPSDGHIYPYGQKLHPSPRVDRSIIRESVLYVTVEPCVMCASLLRQLGIMKVYFGAVNDKFGGTGGVFRIHMNSPTSMPAASTPASPESRVIDSNLRPDLGTRAVSCNSTMEGENNDPAEDINIATEQVYGPPLISTALEGHGGNVERGYEAEGGWGRDEAVTLLRQFYVQENGRGMSPALSMSTPSPA
jgi:tRNA(Arg) A34 adenosine deaminase TadA